MFRFWAAIGDNSDSWKKRVFCSPLAIDGVERRHKVGMISEGRDG